MAAFSASKEGCARVWAKRFQEANSTEEALHAHRIMRAYVRSRSYIEAVRMTIIMAGGSFEEDEGWATSEASR